MADNYRFFVICPSCEGYGVTLLSRELAEGEVEDECPVCVADPGNPLSPIEIDGKRHVYHGRFMEVEDE